MLSHRTVYRMLLSGAAAILLATAGLHATGLDQVSERLARSELSADWVAIFEGLWLMFSIHLALVAVLLVALAVRPAGRAVLAVAAAVPIADTVLLLAVVGPFIGSILTGAAALLCLAALIRLPGLVGG